MARRQVDARVDGNQSVLLDGHAGASRVVEDRTHADGARAADGTDVQHDTVARAHLRRRAQARMRKTCGPLVQSGDVKSTLPPDCHVASPDAVR